MDTWGGYSAAGCAATAGNWGVSINRRVIRQMYSAIGIKRGRWSTGRKPGRLHQGIGRLCRSSNSHSRGQSRQFSIADAFTCRCLKGRIGASVRKERTSLAATLDDQSNAAGKQVRLAGRVNRLRHHRVGACPRCTGASNNPRGFHTGHTTSTALQSAGRVPERLLSQGE